MVNKVLCERYRIYSEPMTPHAIGGLAGSRRTPVAASGGRYGRLLKVSRHIKNSDSVNWCIARIAYTWRAFVAHLLHFSNLRHIGPKWHSFIHSFIQMSSRSDLKRRSLRLFEDGCPNNNNNNKMSRDMGSVTDPKLTLKVDLGLSVECFVLRQLPVPLLSVFNSASSMYI